MREAQSRQRKQRWAQKNHLGFGWPTLKRFLPDSELWEVHKQHGWLSLHFNKCVCAHFSRYWLSLVSQLTYSWEVWRFRLQFVLSWWWFPTIIFTLTVFARIVKRPWTRSYMFIHSKIVNSLFNRIRKKIEGSTVLKCQRVSDWWHLGNQKEMWTVAPSNVDHLVALARLFKNIQSFTRWQSSMLTSEGFF